ncbi:Rod shape-determining protein RodA [invertebrate metagenome]|uniref:Rod shape-determining protein RodA n=1 Tax=invertebrate metagenome TaxID=1711999 RepID=A0A484H6M3_9ZZZZ
MYTPPPLALKGRSISVREKLLRVNWSLVSLINGLGVVSIAALLSAADGSLEPWAGRQAVRFLGSIVVMLSVSLIDVRFWMQYSYCLYYLCLFLLVFVEWKGTIGMGAQRWIDLGFIQLQPSEMMKVALTLSLARYFHSRSLEEVAQPIYLLLPLVTVLLPVVLVLKQPDLGTALMLLMVSGVLFFLAGVRLWHFFLVILSNIIFIPVTWQYIHAYQRERILTFLNPERDPLGAGYHIIQSKIALGSGGLFGKGFGKGTQSHLNFLPEKQTDFIFTMWAEEHGLVGSVALLVLYAIVIVFSYTIALRSRHQFGRLLGLGLTTTFFLYVFINAAMVTGLIPVVGIPLPLISYGGTAMVTVMFGFGLLLSVEIHGNVQISRYGP